MNERSPPPSPDGVPLLGNGLAFSRDPFGSVTRWAREGSVVRLTFPGQSLYVVSDPALVQDVLVERQEAFTVGRQQRETFEGIEDDAVTASTGDEWKRLRSSLHPAFTWEGVRSFAQRMADLTAAHVSYWEVGDRFDLLREMRLLTLRILGDTLLDVDVAGDEAVVMDAADALVDRSDPRRFGRLLPDWVPTPTRRRFVRTVEDLDEYVAAVLADASPGDRSVGSVLLAAHERGELSLAEVRDNLTALLLAGQDSTALTLTYAWYELCRHPDLRTVVAEEAESVLGSEEPWPSRFDALRRTRTAVRETLRLYPPTWAVSREALEPVSLGGYEIPAGAQMMLPQWVLHRDARFWDAPETFDPSRWSRERDRPEYAYFPFSGGPRLCIGMRFARLELAVALATMVHHTDLAVETAEPLTFSPSLSLRPETEIEAVVRDS